jgi:hypothetical protein
MSFTRAFVAVLTLILGVSGAGIRGQATTDIFDPNVLHRINLNLHTSD